MACLDESLSDVSQGNALEGNGWFTNVTAFNSHYNSQCGDKTWFGWGSLGAIWATLKGYGTATLVFGNCYQGGHVKVYLNNKLIGNAPPNMKKLKATFPYSKGDVLTLTEDHGIIKLHELSFNCKGE